MISFLELLTKTFYNKMQQCGALAHCTGGNYDPDLMYTMGSYLIFYQFYLMTGVLSP